MKSLINFLFLLFLTCTQAFGQLNFPPNHTVFTALQSGSWSNSNTWGGSVPTDNSVVVIPENISVTVTSLLDTNHKFVQVNGNLYMSIHQNTRLKVETLQISSNGYFRVGLPNFRVKDDKSAEIIFTSDGAPIDLSWDSKQLSRGLLSKGKIDIYGKEKTHMIPVNTNVFAGASSINLDVPIPTDWEIGDKLVLPGTVFLRDQDFQDEQVTIKSISGSTLEFYETFAYDHVRVNNMTPLHLANLNRNVTFKSENSIEKNRGHIMLMNNEVKIEHAAFIDLGRTDKSRALDEIIADPNTGGIIPGPKTNVRGRYSIHFHKNGYGKNVNVAPSKIKGCVVNGSPGWGYVNHSSHVDFQENICYDFVGAGFVTESGDELGSFTNNIAIKGTGEGVYRPTRLVFSNPDRPQPLSDFGFSGDGFWFQGPAIKAINNVAANCNGTGMIFFTIGSIEINDNQMIGMDENIVRAVYANYENINGLNPRHWLHAPNEVHLGDLPILECRDFQAYACQAGFRFRFNNAESNPFFNADFRETTGITDIWGYNSTIKNANGYSNPNSADRLNQYVSNLTLWNNEIGLRSRYSSKTTVDNVYITNNLRYSNTAAFYYGMASFFQTVDYSFNNLTIENYGVGIRRCLSDCQNSSHPITVSNDNYSNVAINYYDAGGLPCSQLLNIHSNTITNSSVEIVFDPDPSAVQYVVRYKSENNHYWEYKSATGGNSVVLTDLSPLTNYTYQVIAGCPESPTFWSSERHFSTSCQENLSCGYAIENVWTYGNDCIAPVCIGDNVRLRLDTTEGTTTWTGPNGFTGVGNANNTIFLVPVTEDHYGEYEVTHVSDSGCVSIKTIEVLPVDNLEMGYKAEGVWTYGFSNLVPVCIGDTDVRLRLNTTEGSSLWTKPDGTTLAGNANNTIFLGELSGDEYGTYKIRYQNSDGCEGVYYMEVVPNSDIGFAYRTNNRSWINVSGDTITANENDDLHIRLVDTEGTSDWQGPNGQSYTGNSNNTIFINPLGVDDFGLYTVHYSNENGCNFVKTIHVISAIRNSNEILSDTNHDSSNLYNTLYVYPNPVHSDQLLTINLTSNITERQTFFITETNGKIVKKVSIDIEAGNNQFQLDVSNVSTGLYFLMNNQGSTAKIVIK